MNTRFFHKRSRFRFAEYDHLESTMDRFEDVANEISAIVIENV
jgi:hypothetical protein